MRAMMRGASNITFFFIVLFSLPAILLLDGLDLPSLGLILLSFRTDLAMFSRPIVPFFGTCDNTVGELFLRGEVDEHRVRRRLHGKRFSVGTRIGRTYHLALMLYIPVAPLHHLSSCSDHLAAHNIASRAPRHLCSIDRYCIRTTLAI